MSVSLNLDLWSVSGSIVLIYNWIKPLGAAKTHLYVFWIYLNYPYQQHNPTDCSTYSQHTKKFDDMFSRFERIYWRVTCECDSVWQHSPRYALCIALCGKNVHYASVLLLTKILYVKVPRGVFSVQRYSNQYIFAARDAMQVRWRKYSGLCVMQVLRKFRTYSVHVAPLETAGIFNVEMIPYCGPM